MSSSKAWGVLASLMLPAALRGGPPAPVAREILLDRFWDNSGASDASAPLRQCLASLDTAFNKQNKEDIDKEDTDKGSKSDPKTDKVSVCLRIGRQDVQAAPDQFVTDLDRIFTAHRAALAAPTDAERLRLLMAVEPEFGGEFLAGWTPDDDEAHIWLLLTRAELRVRLMPPLLQLAGLLDKAGDQAAAFDVVRRALALQREHVAARQMALELAPAAGQRNIMQALERIPSFRDAVKKFPRQGLSAVPLPTGRSLQALFNAELTTLPTDRQKALLRLSVLPAPFSAEVAEAVCGVPLSALEALTATPFLRQTEAVFCLPPLVFDCARRRLATSTRNQVRRRLARLCIQTLNTSAAPVNTLPAPFAPAEAGRPFLIDALQWTLEQPPALPQVMFINKLRYCGLNDLALQGVPYLRQIQRNPDMPLSLRLEAGVSSAYILMQADDNAAAIAALELAAALADPVEDRNWLANIYTTLMRAYSNCGDWTAAQRRGQEALLAVRRVEDRQGEAHCIRFLAEIALSAGEPEQALALCETAQELGQRLPPESELIPDSLYWKARVLLSLERWKEASDAIEGALSLWQEAGDTKIGLCLCVLGQIHAGTGRFAEARAHLEHAIERHRRGAREGCRMAAVEALGDVFRASCRQGEARVLYEECLAYHTARNHLPATERLQKKQQSCSVPDTQTTPAES